MLRAGTYVETVDMIIVLALVAFDFSHYHLSVQDGILAKTLIDARPAGITAQVNDGVIYPRTVGGTAFVGSNLCTPESQFCIEGCT